MSLGLVLALGPLAAQAASLVLDQEPIVLGRVETVGVTIRVEEPPGTEGLPLRLSVNVGSFGEVTRVEAGVYKAQYTPPTTRFPQVALVAAWRETGPEAPIDFLRIPLHGTTKIDTVAIPGSEVKVVVGSSEFGPVAVSPRGQASVPVDVPPGVPEAIILIKDRSGATIRRSAAVQVPPYNRLTVALVPHAVLANGEDWVRVEVFYDSANPVPPQKVSLTPSEGTATLLRTAPRRYVYKYVAPAGSLSKEVTFQVAVEGDPAAKSQAVVALGMPPPAEVVVTPPEKPIYCDGKAWAKVQVRVFDSRRLGLPHQHVEVMANGQLVKEVEYKGSGLYEARLVAPAAYPEGGLIRLAATVIKPDGQGVTSTANYRVLALPLPSSVRGQVSPQPLEADGKARAAITLDVKDKAGLPLLSAQLIAVASHGSASPVQELGEGRYRIDYVAPEGLPPNNEALVRVVDSSNTYETVIPVALRREQRLLLGVRGGFAHSLKDLWGARAGVDLFVPFRVGGANLGVQATATVGWADQTLTGTSGESKSSAFFVPITLRVEWAPLVTKRAALYLGAGAVAGLARVHSDANGYDASKAGFGAMGFVAGVFNLGPGQAFVEAGYTWCPIEHPDFRLDAGGVGLELGYRFGLF